MSSCVCRPPADIWVFEMQEVRKCVEFLQSICDLQLLLRESHTYLCYCDSCFIMLNSLYLIEKPSCSKIDRSRFGAPRCELLVSV